MALAMMAVHEHDTRAKRRSRTWTKHSRYRKDYYNSLDAEEKRIRQRRFGRDSLLHQNRSPWRKLYYSNDNQGMITLTGFDFNAFNTVCSKFEPVFDAYSPFGKDDNVTITLKISKRGRKRNISAKDCLGLVLAWTRTRGSLSRICRPCRVGKKSRKCRHATRRRHVGPTCRRHGCCRGPF